MASFFLFFFYKTIEPILAVIYFEIFLFILLNDTKGLYKDRKHWKKSDYNIRFLF